MIQTARLSLEEYHRIVGTGILRDRQLERIEGLRVELSPETPYHANQNNKVHKYLLSRFDGLADVCSGHPITLTASEPQPDRVLARLPESLDETRHPQPNDIYLLIEISTLEHNLNAKKHLYAQAKISDYWMIDLQNRRVIAFRAPERTNYTQESKLTPGVISALALPKIDLEVKRLLA